MHGASEQCMQATETDFSPGTPSLSVTTRRRFTPQGTSFSFLQAVTQPLHSMQRSESQMNFILAISCLLLSRLKGGMRPLGEQRIHEVMSVGVHDFLQAFSTLQTVVLVSCIIVTLS